MQAFFWLEWGIFRRSHGARESDSERKQLGEPGPVPIPHSKKKVKENWVRTEVTQSF
jgi:hypothetical protein